MLMFLSCTLHTGVPWSLRPYLHFAGEQCVIFKYRSILPRRDYCIKQLKVTYVR